MSVRKILRILFVCVPVGYVVLSLLLVILLKWMPVFVTPLMIVRAVENRDAENYCTRKKWVPLEKISSNMPKAVIASEDQKFFIHNGFDFEEINKMRQAHKKKGKPVRGCSTISQQTAKNCFTFCSRTWMRKAVEAYYTVLIEKIWGKERILEVYLNVVEMGPGIYGTEAAAVEYFGHKAVKMSATEAATLACCLPNPLKRNPKWVNRHMSHRRAEIVRAMYSVRYK